MPRWGGCKNKKKKSEGTSCDFNPFPPQVQPVHFCHCIFSFILNIPSKLSRHLSLWINPQNTEIFPLLVLLTLRGSWIAEISSSSSHGSILKSPNLNRFLMNPFLRDQSANFRKKETGASDQNFKLWSNRKLLQVFEQWRLHHGQQFYQNETAFFSLKEEQRMTLFSVEKTFASFRRPTGLQQERR